MRPASDVRDTDNRDTDAMMGYYEDRITALLKHIDDLEQENARLKRNGMNAHLGAVEAA